MFKIHHMKMTYVILLSFVLIIISFWAGVEFQRTIDAFDELGMTSIKTKRLDFYNYEDALYLKRKVWGISGNHQTMEVTTTLENSKPDNDSDSYIYKGVEKLIYKIEGDTLKLYSIQDPVLPKQFESSIPIEIIKLKNYGEWNSIQEQINNNYQVFE